MNIEEIKQDISSLEYEIKELQTRKTDVQTQIDEIDKRKPILESINSLKALIREKTPTDNLERSDIINTENKKRKLNKTVEQLQEQEQQKNGTTNDDSGYFPAVPMEHEFFDPSIVKYFKEPSTIRQKKPSNDQEPEPSTTTTAQGEEEPDISSKLDNILLENIYRMFGITLFPLVNPDRFRANKVHELLGVRIEIFDQFKGTFETPYYLILQRNKNQKWITFKRTIPIYIQIEKFIGMKNGVEDLELISILQRLRTEIMDFSFKRQLFRYLESECKFFQIKQADYKFENVVIDIDTLDSGNSVKVSLKLDNTTVVVSKVLESKLSDEKSAKVALLLKGNLKSLAKRIRYITENN
ncbi:hypothetical protein WICPIJ_006774 [Wickerhamomyces pijperi]|uniref:Central kinetochore subunit MCM21 n=1 Tax=Wickerhamomyces pijperi TaxID=599730 RepID=A0A9P8TKN1_WICPI|nr:hypothetical protein WICPIJ_006774 [Wickerhamomyces pijperi]